MLQLLTMKFSLILLCHFSYYCYFCCLCLANSKFREQTKCTHRVKTYCFSKKKRDFTKSFAVLAVHLRNIRAYHRSCFASGELYYHVTIQFSQDAVAFPIARIQHPQFFTMPSLIVLLFFANIWM